MIPKNSSIVFIVIKNAHIRLLKASKDQIEYQIITPVIVVEKDSPMTDFSINLNRKGVI